MFTIYLICHSHIDIGYTERQERIGMYQADFIRQAVSCVLDEKQHTRTEDNKFRFTAEGFYAVEQYLKRYGEDGRKALTDAVKTGCFELTGGYFHMAELLNERNLSHSLDFAQDFVRTNGLPAIDTAMSCDVNGFSWGFADALYDHGIRYLSTNINPYHGEPPFGKPLVPFYWESPKGNKLLVWNGFSYHKANILGLIPGYTPGGGTGIDGMSIENRPFIDVTDTSYPVRRVRELVDVLKKGGYAYDFVPLMCSGLYTDNSPVSDVHCEFVKQINRDLGGEIEIVTATLGDFFKRLSQYADTLPTYRGDWNDWWTDGVISTPNETCLFRNAQRVNEYIHRLDHDMRIVSPEEHEHIEKNLIYYAEHTWGHSASLTNPCDLLVAQLDARKARYASAADLAAGEAFDKLSRTLGEGEFAVGRPFAYRVINPHPFEKTDVVYLPTDYWEENHFYGHGFHVEDENGNLLPSQKTASLRGSVIACVVTLPPHGSKSLFIRFDDAPQPNTMLHRPITSDTVFENANLRLTFGSDGIHSLYYKPTSEELLDASAPKLGEPVYQLFPNGHRPAPGVFHDKEHRPVSELHRAEAFSCELVEKGDVLTHIRMTCRIPGTVEYSVHYQLYNALSKFEMRVETSKSLVRDPEGLYVSLPFKTERGAWYLDKAGAFFKLGDALPMTCADYFCVCRGAVLSGEKCGIAVNTYDSPMLTFDGPRLWEYTRTVNADGKAMSWLTNNKWDTNFRTHCAGYLSSRYVFEPYAAEASPETGLKLLESNEYNLLAVRA